MTCESIITLILSYLNKNFINPIAPKITCRLCGFVHTMHPTLDPTTEGTYYLCMHIISGLTINRTILIYYVAHQLQF